MGIQELKLNIEQEKKLAIEINRLVKALNYSKRMRDINGERLIKNNIYSLINQIRILNNSTPRLLQEITIIKKLPTDQIQNRAEKIEEKLIGINYSNRASEMNKVTIKEADKNSFLNELQISESSLKKLKKDNIKKEEEADFKKPSLYAKISNKFFSEFAISFINKGYFRSLDIDLKKANFPITTSTYISMILFSTLISFFISILTFTFFLFFKLSLDLPFVLPAEGEILTNIIKTFWIIIATPIVIFLVFYYYPTSERKTISKKIEQELPFVALHMSAIASSGIEPSNIFKIIALGKEYPYTQKEARKLMNQLNLYGYDVVTALRNLARTTSSKKLSELLTGLATTINSGGSLTDFLNKRAETLLFEYKLEREKYTRVAETFMDIYISVVIAAPMILMLLLIMINITGISLGFGLGTLTVLIVSIISLINILFLVFLNLKQPGY